MSDVVFVTGEDAKLFPHWKVKMWPPNAPAAEQRQECVARCEVPSRVEDGKHVCWVWDGNTMLAKVVVPALLAEDHRLVAVNMVIDELKRGKQGRVVTL